MSKIINKIKLTEEEISYLKSILSQPTIEARMYIRARILLLKHEGCTRERIAGKLDISLSTVKLCLKKFSDGGVDAALNDRKGRGRKREISDSDITWVINKACEKPSDHGYSAELWYPASFTRFIRSVAEPEGHPRMADVSESTLRTILKNARIRPFKVTYYCEKRDPDFKEKMHDVLVIYKQVSMQFDEEGNLRPFEGVPVHTLSYDENQAFRQLARHVRTGRRFRVRKKTARSNVIMSMYVLAPCPSWPVLICLQGKQFLI